MLKIYQKAAAQASSDDRLVLSYDERKKGRLKSVTEQGEDIGLFLERGQVLQDGELLQSECGKVIAVQAANEDVVTARTDDWLNFSKVCYHLGNRHLPLQIGERWIRFQPDHVLEELAALYGLQTERESAAFNPESGAYSSGGHSGESGHHHHHHD